MEEQKHVFISYEKSSKAVARHIAVTLKARDIPVSMSGGSGNINKVMAEGVENAAVFLPLMTAGYQKARNTGKEFNYADQLAVPMVCVHAQAGWKASSWLGAVTAGKPTAAVTSSDAAGAESIVTLIKAAWSDCIQPGRAGVSAIPKDDGDVLFDGGYVSGYYEYPNNGKRDAMRVEYLTCKRGRIRGQGDDVVGPFTIMGTYKSKSSEVASFFFKKQYLGAHLVEYKGQIRGTAGSPLSMDGTWTVPGSWNGPFHFDLDPDAQEESSTKTLTKSGKHGVVLFHPEQAAMAARLTKDLCAQGFKLVCDTKSNKKVVSDMIDQAAVAVVLMSQAFQTDDVCHDYLKHADDREIDLIAVMAQPFGEWKQSGWLGLIMSGQLWTDLSDAKKFTENLTQVGNALVDHWPDAKGLKTSIFGEGQLHGYYEQDGKRTAMLFQHFTIADNRIGGHGSDNVGVFDIHGFVSDYSFEFTKQYKGAHAVIYKGKIESNDAVIVLAGMWSVGRYQGAFELKLDRPKKMEGGHVMISYQWGSQPLVKKLHDRLKDTGIPLWFDIAGDMKGNINEAMANGVEKAVVMMVCTTEAYGQSRNCSKELNYAKQLEKPIVAFSPQANFKPDGWLATAVDKAPILHVQEDALDKAVDELSARIKQMWVDVGGEVNDQPEDVLFDGGKVSGFWMQNGSKGDMQVEYLTMRDGRIRGQGDDSVGAFTILGTYEKPAANKSIKVRFDKQYVGAHLVVYNGTISQKSGGLFMSGTWNIGRNNTGKFEFSFSS